MNKKYSVSPKELSRRLRQQKKEILANNPNKIIEPQYFQGVQGSTLKLGFWVNNWQTGWKWLSTWAFAAIGYVSLYGIPPEVLALVPEASQSKVTAALALLGFVGRFINQSRVYSKSSPTPPLEKDGL